MSVPTQHSLVTRLILVLGALGALFGAGYLWLQLRNDRIVFREHTDRILNESERNFREVTDSLIDTTESYREVMVESLLEAGEWQLADAPLAIYPDEPAMKRAIIARWRGRADLKRAAAREAEQVIRRRVREEVASRVDTMTGAGERKAEVLVERAARRSLWTAAGVAAALVLAFGIALYWTVIRPTRQLTRSADRIAAGDLAERAPTGRRDEFGRLADAFNRMVGSLEGAIADVERLNTDLEARVAQKSKELAHASKMSAIGTLAGGVAHEFNNLLGGIMGSAEAALEEDDCGPDTRAAVEMIRRTASRASVITADLLRFARPTLGTERTRIDAMILDAVRLAGPEGRARDVRLEPRVADDAASHTLPAAFHQVVLNLLVNAIHASPDEGTVTVSANVDGDAAVITVHDHGPGIPPEAREHVFEPFFTTKAPNAGTGLGLSVSYGIVERYGGSLDFDCPTGGGTTFTIRLDPSSEAAKEEQTNG